MNSEQAYSAPVELELNVNGENFQVAQVGGGSLYLRTPRRLPAVPAEIIVTIAGVRKVHPVILRASGANDPPAIVYFDNPNAPSRSAAPRAASA